MKKFFLSALTAVAIMFSACSNSDDVVSPEGNDGSVKLAMKFEEANASGIRALPPKSTAIPKTSWGNINKVRLFLYNPTTGVIGYSHVVDPSTIAVGDPYEFGFYDVPSGTGYELLLMANVNSSEDPIATSVNGWGSFAEFGNHTVRTKTFNTDVVMDLQKLDATKLGNLAAQGHVVPAARVLYNPISEIFTASKSGVDIITGVTRDITSTPLPLKREVSMMRVRIDKTVDFLNEPGAEVNFNHTSNLIAVQTIADKFGVKVGSFAGGILGAADREKIVIGANGNNTFRTTDPTTATHTNNTVSGANPTVIVPGSFTLWQEIIVLPNTTKAEGKAAADNAEQSRKYTVIVSAWAPAGYEFDNGTTLAAAGPVYWSGIIDEVFLENNIREVNLTIKSRGDKEWPEIKEEGGLEITVGAPLQWEDAIESSNKEI